jgi:hypothetical protein
MTRSSVIVAAALSALLGCRSELLGSTPRPAAVVPGSGYSAVATAITIVGDGFRVEPYEDSGGRPAVDATFRAWLGGAELERVEWVSERELRARVPAGIAAGSLRLDVQDPRGARGSLEAAFTVIAGLPPGVEAGLVATDPFGDGTPFSFVFGYAGSVFLGPSGDGRGVIRCLPDGSGCASFALHFQRDVTGFVSATSTTTSVHQNTCPDYATIGSAQPAGSPSWCDPDNPAATACFCGPNYESGRGLLDSFVLGDQEWLVAMGRSKKRELRYLYMTTDTASPLDFSYVDVTASIPSALVAVEDVVSMAALNDRLYVGLQVDGAQGAPRPRMITLVRTPTRPGLDATAADTLATTFANTPMGEASGVGPSISQVDALRGFEGRLFVANRRAVLVSTTGAPDLSADAATQFDDCTPLDPLAPGTGWAATSIPSYLEKVDVTPAQMGVTGLAEWQGRLYLARNTAAGVPEAWVFTPRHDALGQFLGCAADRSDWRLVATGFGDPGNAKVTALFASRSYLYVGFDNATSGLQLFRTAAIAPSGEADFRGRHGCTAPCEPVGTAGFGDAANTRFLDARAIGFGPVDQVWATVGGASRPVRVFRISE